MGREHGGNLSYWNMRKFREGMAAGQISEYTLYSDSRIIGEYCRPTSPYRFINLIPFHYEPGEIREALTLRISWVINAERKFGTSTDRTSYHGGWASDELAALASLRLGIRLKAGGETRIFGAYSEDPLGTPIASREGKPDLLLRSQRLVLPSVFNESNLESLQAIDLLRNVSESQFTALVRSARQFQSAIWIAESEPELAWLLLVSAIETAANEWSSTLDTNTSPQDMLIEIKPEFSEQIIESGGAKTHAIVADELTRTLRATKKFLDFCIEFLPQPPKQRPPLGAQISWDKKHLKKILNKIYNYRSLALHEGIPFPAPLCRAPDRTEEDGRVSHAETGTLALAVHALGASWKSDDLPISMNTFCHLVQGTLNNWWDKIGVDNAAPSLGQRS